MFPTEMKTIHDFQAFHQWLDEQKGWEKDLLLNMVLLSGEVGEVANEIKKTVWWQDLGLELADCLRCPRCGWTWKSVSMYEGASRASAGRPSAVQYTLG